MELVVTTKHSLMFQVEYRESTEGGMDWQTFGNCVGSLPEAVAILEQARVAFRDRDWFIRCDVETKVSTP